MMSGSLQIWSRVLTRMRSSPLTAQVIHRLYGSRISSRVMISGPSGPNPGMFLPVQKREPEATSRFCRSRQVRSLRMVTPTMWSKACGFFTPSARLPTTNTSSGS